MLWVTILCLFFGHNHRDIERPFGATTRREARRCARRHRYSHRFPHSFHQNPQPPNASNHPDNSQARGALAHRPGCDQRLCHSGVAIANSAEGPPRRPAGTALSHPDVRPRVRGGARPRPQASRPARTGKPG